MRVSGLDDVLLNELVEFENGAYGIALNLEPNSVGVVMLSDYYDLKEGSSVKRTGKVIQAPVGDGLLGRVIDPIGLPIDGKGELKILVVMPQLNG